MDWLLHGSRILHLTLKCFVLDGAVLASLFIYDHDDSLASIDKFRNWKMAQTTYDLSRTVCRSRFQRRRKVDVAAVEVYAEVADAVEELVSP